MKSHWKTHQEKRIYYFDLSNFGEDEKGLMDECDAADAVIMAEPPSSVLILNDVRGSEASVEAIKHLQLSADRSSPYIARAAVVGVMGSKRLLLQLVNRFSKHPIVPFDDVESAKDWLVKDQSME